MRKFAVFPMVTVLLLFVGTSSISASAQAPANDNAPTFYRLVPGTYVNPWPRFTVRYPKDWIEQVTRFGELFHVRTPGAVPGSMLAVAPIPDNVSLDTFADFLERAFRTMGTNVTVVTDKAIQLRDGIPAREVEISYDVRGTPARWLALGTNKYGKVIYVGVGGRMEKIGDDLRAILSSIEYRPGKDEPVTVSPDVQEFLDRWRGDLVSHDLAKVMSHYSDIYLESGETKGEVEHYWKQYIGQMESVEVGVTDFVPAGDKAHLAGFLKFKTGTHVLRETSIIKENGEWKWYGNQRDVAPSW